MDLAEPDWVCCSSGHTTTVFFKGSLYLAEITFQVIRVPFNIFPTGNTVLVFVLWVNLNVIFVRFAEPRRALCSFFDTTTSFLSMTLSLAVCNVALKRGFALYDLRAVVAFLIFRARVPYPKEPESAFCFSSNPVKHRRSLTFHCSDDVVIDFFNSSVELTEIRSSYYRKVSNGISLKNTVKYFAHTKIYYVVHQC